MFDIGGSELLVIGVVALIVVGPKDLPKMFHALGQFTAKARQMAREFQRAMENAADEAGVGDVASDLKSLNSMRNLGSNALSEASKRLESWDETKRANTAGLQPDPDAPVPGAEPEGSAESGDWAAEAATEPGPATRELTEKRKAQASARAEAAASTKTGAKTVAAKAPARKTATKSTAAKSAAAKTTPAKTAPKTTSKAAPKTATKSTAAKSTAAKAPAKPAPAKAAAKPAATKPKATKTATKAAKPPKEGDA